VVADVPEDERAVVGLASREVDIPAVFDEYDAHESAEVPS
jgi:hypothetical protein